MVRSVETTAAEIQVLAPATTETPIPETQATPLPPIEKKEVKKFYLAKPCKCGETKIFFPEHQKFVCLNCHNMKGPTDSEKPEDYLTDDVKKKLAEIRGRSRFAHHIPDIKNYEFAHKQDRNDECACGSGKKYKKCCMLKTDSKMERKISEFHDELYLDAVKRNIALVKGIRLLFKDQAEKGWTEKPFEAHIEELKASVAKAEIPETPPETEEVSA